MFSRALCTLAIIGLSSFAHAAGDNTLSSCRSQLKLPAAASTEVPLKELFVIIDQTFKLDSGLQEEVISSAERLAAPGNAFKVMTFSAFIANKYGTLQSSGTFDHPIPESQISNIGMKTIKQFEACLPQQVQYGKKMLRESIGKSFSESSSDIAKSEIFLSLKDFSEGVIHASKAKEKVILLVSDMLENSAITSFYTGKGIKTLKQADEVKKIEAANIFPDFGGARIYVVGSGTIGAVGAGNPKGGKDASYRSTSELLALEGFWKEYFKRSNGQLVKFGMPSLSGVQVD